MKVNRLTRIKLLILMLVSSLQVTYADPLELAFDFSNYVDGTQPDQLISNTGTAFDGLKLGMLYQDVVIGSAYDIDAVLSSTSDYVGSYIRNGNVGSDIQINQAINQLSTYNLSFYESGTTNLFDFESLPDDVNYSLTLYDIDGSIRNGVRTETIEFLTDGEFQLTTTTTIDQIDDVTFTNQQVGNVPNPLEGATDLTAEQEDASVIGSFTNQNSIDFKATTGGVGGNRNIFIDGGDFSEFDNATVAPGAPTPPFFALVLFMLISAFKSRLCNN